MERNITWLFIHESDFENEDYKAVFKKLDEYVSELYVGVCYLSLSNNEDGSAQLNLMLYPSKEKAELALEKALGGIFDDTD